MIASVCILETLEQVGRKQPEMSDINYGLSYTPTPVLKTLYIDIQYHCKVSEVKKIIKESSCLLFQIKTFSHHFHHIDKSTHIVLQLFFTFVEAYQYSLRANIIWWKHRVTDYFNHAFFKSNIHWVIHIDGNLVQYDFFDFIISSFAINWINCAADTLSEMYDGINVQ